MNMTMFSQNKNDETIFVERLWNGIHRYSDREDCQADLSAKGSAIPEMFYMFDAAETRYSVICYPALLSRADFEHLKGVSAEYCPYQLGTVKRGPVVRVDGQMYYVVNIISNCPQFESLAYAGPKTWAALKEMVETTRQGMREVTNLIWRGAVDAKELEVLEGKLNYVLGYKRMSPSGVTTEWVKAQLALLSRWTNEVGDAIATPDAVVRHLTERVGKPLQYEPIAGISLLSLKASGDDAATPL